jgi:hypothetical protein
MPNTGTFPAAPRPWVAFPPASEVGLIQFDLTTQENIGVGCMIQNGHPDRAHGPINSLVGHLHLLGHLPDRYFQLKELEDRQPLHAG